MSGTSTTRPNEPAYDLFDRWLAHRQQENDVVAERHDSAPPVAAEQAVPVEELVPVEEPVVAVELPQAETVDPLGALDLDFQTPGRADLQDTEVIQTEEEFEEFAHPALGGAAGAPPSLGPETAEVSAVHQPAPTRSPETVDALAAEPPAPVEPPAPARPATAPPGLVLFSPRRGARTLVTVVAAVLAGATGVAGYLAWQAPTRTSIGVAAVLGVALFLAWRLRDATDSTAVTIERGVLRVVRGRSVHQFPLAGSQPPIDLVGEPDRRSWKVLIQRRGMPPFVITRRMVDPVEFTETLRHFRPDV